jgi:hypothetical protein
MYSRAMGMGFNTRRPRILVTCWRRPLPTHLGERTAHSRPVEPGDVVAVEVDGIGRLENHVVQSGEALGAVGEQPAVSAQTLHVALTMPEDEAERQVEAVR